MLDEQSRAIARKVIHHDLFEQRTDVLAELVSTKGATDWVWLEERLSTELDGCHDYDRYAEVFAYAGSLIRERHPDVRVPEKALINGR